MTSESPSTDSPLSTGQLLSAATEQISTLVRAEMRLAEVEMTAKAKKGLFGAGLFTASAAVGYLGVASLVAAAIIAIAMGVPAWLSAIIVGIALLAIAGILAALGRSRVKQATPPLPTETIEGGKADIQAVKEAIRR